MSNADTRAEIATALSTVSGIRGHVSRPAALNEGDAWPQWRGGVPRAGAVENTWIILIVLPGTDDVTADGFADSHGEFLLEALRPVLYVDSIAPATIDVEPGQMYALMITGRAE